MNYQTLIQAIDQAHQQAQAKAVTAVNKQLIIRNWLTGAYLVEFEQNGNDRATYGTNLIQSVAQDLKSNSIKGLGVSMLKNCRSFYRIYPQIRQSLIGELKKLPENLFVSRYLIALPQPEQLQKLIETDRAIWSQHHS